MTRWLAVAAGSAAGGLARFWMSEAILHRFGKAFPWGTLAVNLLGCLFIGVLAARADRLSEETRLLLATGFCGGFTTFSTFTLETAGLSAGRAALYTIASVAGGLGAFRLGLMSAR